MLEVSHLTKNFGGLAAVRNVTTRFERGQIGAIIGPNGAGKTTFFNLISGFHHPTSGSVLIEGNEVSHLRPDQVATLGVARTFQTTTLFDQASVLDNLIIGHRLRTQSNLLDVLLNTKRLREDERLCRVEAEKALDFVELGHLGESMAGDLTQEERKRVAFAMALATGPKIVLLDEPAGGVNPDETQGLARLIRKMVNTGLTVCLIEHKMDMIMRLADRIVVLDHGEMIAEGRPSEIQSDPRVIEAYLGADYVAA